MNEQKLKKIINLLIREGEGLSVEFKERYTSRIDEDIVAFANAKDGAVLLGVRDDGLKEARWEIADRPNQNTAQHTIQKTVQTTDQKIVALIQRRPDVTRRELAKAIGISDSGVKYQLKRMQERKLIRRVGPDRGGHWEIESSSGKGRP